MSANPEPSFDLVNGDFAAFRPRGHCSILEVAALVCEAIRSARDQGITRLMIVLTPVVYETLSMANQYYRIREWADVARGAVSVALVVTPDKIDPSGFVSTVASNACINLEYFTTESAAMAWLQVPVGIPSGCYNTIPRVEELSVRH